VVAAVILRQVHAVFIHQQACDPKVHDVPCGIDAPDHAAE
jgi:hypothetical protein